MSGWQEFEYAAADYLNETFGQYATFDVRGGADSTTPDILVHTNTGNCFYIEAKEPLAQCGQFVLIPNMGTSRFDFSIRNKTEINLPTRQIMDFMDSDFDRFSRAGTAGESIVMPNGDAVFAKWIIQYYRDKDVRFFVTSDPYSGTFIIFPINDFPLHFNIEATYRIKKSGSRDVGAKRKQRLLDFILHNNYGVYESRCTRSKLFVCSNQNLDNTTFVFDGLEFMFSRRNSEYELRLLSQTANANVIFSISKIAGRRGLSSAEFICELK